MKKEEHRKSIATLCGNCVLTYTQLGIKCSPINYKNITTKPKDKCESCHKAAAALHQYIV